MSVLKQRFPQKTVFKGFCMTILLVFLTHPLLAQTAHTVAVREWLISEVTRIHYPVFSDQKDIKGNFLDGSALLKWPHDEVLDWWPQASQSSSKTPGSGPAWKKVTADSDNRLFISPLSENQPEVAYLAVYVKTDRWIKAKLQVNSPHPFQIFLDGQLLESKVTSVADADNPANRVEKPIKLETGKHLVLLKSLKDHQLSQEWFVQAGVTPVDSAQNGALQLTTDPSTTKTVEILLNSPSMGQFDLSGDGQLIALQLSQVIAPGDKPESWMEIRNLRSGQLLQEFRGGVSINQFQWAPQGRQYAFTSPGNEGTNVYIGDLKSGTQQLLLRGVKGFSGYQWAPDNSFLIYAVQEEYKEDPGGLKKLEGMEDRQPLWRNRSFLYQIDLKSKGKKRLTAGLHSTNLHAIRPDGNALIFSITRPDYSERPYSRTTFYQLHLKDLSYDSLFTESFSRSVEYAPDGKKLLVTGGPSLFGGIGLNVPENTIPNDYDIQAYIYDLSSGKAEAISKNFDPSINQAFWSRNDGMIYFLVTEQSFRNVYRYDPAKGRFKPVKNDLEVVDQLQLAAAAPWAAVRGTSVSLPEQLLAIDLKKETTHLIRSTAGTLYDPVRFGEVKRWTFFNRDGKEIEGRVYYPPDFDSQKQYPCIVYYYGGTSPVERNFGGRYPKNIWAANGYIVYVLQPSGAIGFGQTFSALHVNNWGKTVADEIIDGVKQFLAAHPFVDPKRVGSIGASYGGFMTMLLQTRTNMFACAVSHAGISGISSYWGEGYWGYLYSAVATANSFPWNRKDIYIEQSPLYQADKITTPLLLLHGKEDTNVPPGESIQLFTALKLLGREVEYIEIAGQNHHIMEHNKRKQWTKTIIAWFDKYLKDQPQWWDDMYPSR